MNLLGASEKSDFFVSTYAPTHPPTHLPDDLLKDEEVLRVLGGARGVQRRHVHQHRLGAHSATKRRKVVHIL